MGAVPKRKVETRNIDTRTSVAKRKNENELKSVVVLTKNVYVELNLKLDKGCSERNVGLKKCSAVRIGGGGEVNIGNVEEERCPKINPKNIVARMS